MKFAKLRATGIIISGKLCSIVIETASLIWILSEIKNTVVFVKYLFLMCSFCF